MTNLLDMVDIAGYEFYPTLLGLKYQWRVREISLDVDIGRVDACMQGPVCGQVGLLGVCSERFDLRSR